MVLVLKRLGLKTPLYVIKIIENALKVTKNIYGYGGYLSIFTILGMKLKKKK